ncbi:ATP-binding protein [Leptothrix ochracea]|uniref:ATP-binding protein n=1 Tax=Leptothrix ochracea TaxID=735331 RepID=UPI0034E28C11
MKPAHPRLIPIINTARCTGCGWCVSSCHLHLLSLEVEHGRKTSVLHDADTCTGCRKCAAKCPFGVITMGDARSAESLIGSPRPA